MGGLVAASLRSWGGAVLTPQIAAAPCYVTACAHTACGSEWVLCTGPPWKHACGSSIECHAAPTAATASQAVTTLYWRGRVRHGRSRQLHCQYGTFLATRSPPQDFLNWAYASKWRQLPYNYNAQTRLEQAHAGGCGHGRGTAKAL